MFCAINTSCDAQSITVINDTSSPLGESGREQKKKLTPKDYKLWSKFIEWGLAEKISNNGNWYTYTLFYNNYEVDTLYIGSTKTDTKYDFPAGKSGQFSEKSRWFGCVDREKGMALLDLETGATRWISKVSKFEFLTVNGKDKYLMASRKSTDSKNRPSLLIMDLINGTEKTISNVSEYQLHQGSNTLVYSIDTESKKSVVLCKLEDAPIPTTITENKLYPYKKLLWSSDGSALAFLQEASPGLEDQKRHKLYYYNVKQGSSQLKCLDPTLNTSLFQGKDITADFGFEISEDGMVVFFNVIGKDNLNIQSKSSLPVEVQVWDTKDKRIYPERIKDQKYGVAEFGAWRTAWWPIKDKTMQLETKALPIAIVSGNGTYMLSYNPTAYAPHFKFIGDIDLYLTDLETGEQDLFLRQFVCEEHGRFKIDFSPGGKYIHYFHKKHWWIYDLKKKTHTNVTKGLGLQLYKTADEGARPVISSYAFPGWTSGDKALIIRDQYDVWLVSPNGKPQRITRGKEKQIRHRVVNSNTDNTLVIETFGTLDKASGYTIWTPKRGGETLVYKDMNVTTLKKAKDREAYIYIEEAFDIAPRICYWEKGLSSPRVLVETNKQQKQFYWGKSELLHYTTSEGQQLQGALFYPANYKPGKTYPMIVNIYEQVSNGLHSYINPTEYLQHGFNRTNYTADGYLVFLPDIKYTFNDPGISAVTCVEAGVKAVLKKGIVEADHIGLIGHSYGGYQTNFIVTQSDLFAAAVAGAGLSDLVSDYHSVSFGDEGMIDGTDMSRIYCFEQEQYRIPDSFYKNPEAYFRNSPLHHAANINTPLLLWAGKKDANVDWRQSIEMYSGLRRLGKACTLLLYPNEGHIMSNKENQLDLTRRIKAWFDGYLKPDDKEQPNNN